MAKAKPVTAGHIELPVEQRLVQLPPLGVQEVALILEGLGTLPAARAGELFVGLKREAERQLNAPQQAATPAAKGRP